jgi:phage baseplate assembly protein W
MSMQSITERQGFAFPIGVDEIGGITALGGDPRIRAKILQILFTAQGERVHQPEFGCGLLNLVFEPNDSVLAPAVQFTVGQALARWLGDEIAVDAVNTAAEGEYIVVEIVYTRKQDLKQQAMRIQFK